MIKPCRPKWKGTMTRSRAVQQPDALQTGLTAASTWNSATGRRTFRSGRSSSKTGLGAMKKQISSSTLTPSNTPTTPWMNPGFKAEVVEETATIKVIRNSDGLLAEVPKGRTGSSIPHYSSLPLWTPEDWKKCKEENFRRDDPVRKIDIAALKKEHPRTRD